MNQILTRQQVEVVKGGAPARQRRRGASRPHFNAPSMSIGRSPPCLNGSHPPRIEVDGINQCLLTIQNIVRRRHRMKQNEGFSLALGFSLFRATRRQGLDRRRHGRPIANALHGQRRQPNREGQLNSSRGKELARKQHKKAIHVALYMNSGPAHTQRLHTAPPPRVFGAL